MIVGEKGTEEVVNWMDKVAAAAAAVEGNTEA